MSLDSSMQKKMALTDFDQQLLSVSEDQTVGVNTMRQWVVHFSSSNSGLPLLVQIFMSKACWLLFIAGKNA